MSEKTVFISYSHDSEEHREKVLALSERLREDGIDDDPRPVCERLAS